MTKNIIMTSGMLPKDVEVKISTSSLPTGKYLRNMGRAFEKLGYTVKNVTHIALPGASTAFYNYENREDHKYILKDKFIFPSVVFYQQTLLNMVQPDDIVIFHNINYVQWGLVMKVKKRQGKCLLILADHTPVEERKHPIRRWMGKKDEKEFKYFEYAILLSQETVKYVNENCKYAIMEGGLDIESFKSISRPKHKDKIVFMYAGTLEPVTGIDRLLNALKKIEADCRLIITGKGSLSTLVQEKSDQDSRIDFKGYVSDAEYSRLLSQADIFVNPRNMELPENQNNFPSKVLEYLAAGRMTISSKFPGWERFACNFTFYDNSVDELAKKMSDAIDICRENSSQKFDINRKRAEDFDWKRQTERIIKLIEE